MLGDANLYSCNIILAIFKIEGHCVSTGKLFGEASIKPVAGG